MANLKLDTVTTAYMFRTYLQLKIALDRAKIPRTIETLFVLHGFNVSCFASEQKMWYHELTMNLLF